MNSIIDLSALELGGWPFVPCTSYLLEMGDSWRKGVSSQVFSGKVALFS